MGEIIISCAGCGKRFKGVHSTKKFKCSGCQNLFSFPDAAREPGYGKTMCSCCWNELDWSEALNACPTCAQKISPSHGGRAILWAAGSSLAPSIPDDRTKSSGPHSDLEAKIAELTAQLSVTQATQSQLQSELDQARAEANARLESLQSSLLAAQREADERNAAMLAARGELEQYRTMAVTALEPLCVDYTRRMRELIAETDKLRANVRDARQDLSQRLDRLEHAGHELRDNLSNTCRDINERLSAVLGVEPDKGEVLEDPKALPEGPLAELLAAGVPITGSAIVVTRHAKV